MSWSFLIERSRSGDPTGRGVYPRPVVLATFLTGLSSPSGEEVIMTVVSFPRIVNAVPAVLDGGEVTDCQGNPKPGRSWSLGVPDQSYGSYVPYEENVWRHESNVDKYHSQKRSGRIIMTPYSVGRKSISRSLVQTSHSSKYWWTNWAHDSSGCCDSFVWDGVSRYSQNHSEGDLASVPVVSNESGTQESDVADMVSATQQQAYARSFVGVDLATELAEAQKTYWTISGLVGGAVGRLESVVAKAPPKKTGWRSMNYKQLRRSADKALRVFSRSWLTAIYGLGPIAYTIGDVKNLARKKANSYHTYRATRNLSFGGGSPLLPPDKYVVVNVTGDVKVRSTVKVRYTLGAPQAIADQVSLNLWRTAWELIPYSFVVDWFANVGDVITSATALDLATERVGCTAVKRNVEHVSSYVDNTSDVSSRSYNPDTVCPVHQNEVFTHTRSVNAVYKVEKEQSYTRTVFSRPSPKVVFDPNLNWKRFITTFALAYEPIRTALRKLG